MYDMFTELSWLLALLLSSKCTAYFICEGGSSLANFELFTSPHYYLVIATTFIRRLFSSQLVRRVINIVFTGCVTNGPSVSLTSVLSVAYVEALILPLAFASNYQGDVGLLGQAGAGDAV